MVDGEADPGGEAEVVGLNEGDAEGLEEGDVEEDEGVLDGGGAGEGGVEVEGRGGGPEVAPASGEG